MRIKKILIINPFGIGDVLFTTPIIHALKDSFPAARIGYLSNRRSAPVLENNPHLDYVFVYERDEFEAVRRKSLLAWLRKMIAFLNQIKKERFEVAFDFSLNTQYGFFSWYSGIKERIGYDYKRRGRFLTKRIKLSGYSGKHIVEYYAGLLKCLGLGLRHAALELYLQEDDKKWAEDALSKEGVTKADVLVGIIPGAGKSWGEQSYFKHWPAKNFSGLADKIVENQQAKIIIMGDFFENKLTQEVKENMLHKAINLSGMTTVGRFAALLSKMAVVITNDGGPLHMAVAVGTKTISIFGPVDERVYGPYPLSKNHVVIKKNLDCRPCYKDFRFRGCFHERRCTKDITVAEVYAAFRSLV